MQKKEVSTPAYGKRVEHLKAVIKSCGMRFDFLPPFLSLDVSLLTDLFTWFIFCHSIPPSIYKKVKQVPENKREAQLIKELEGILSKEGLSSNPSEKGIYIWFCCCTCPLVCYAPIDMRKGSGTFNHLGTSF